MASLAVIGGGPAGLIAAETLAAAGVQVTIYDRMPTLARKFLMAGRGGLNLTHSEPLDRFIARYGAASAWLTPMIENFPPSALRQWCHDLGQPTFVGSSGRIFPEGMKASPLLRLWLRRLNDAGVKFALRHQWRGWDDNGYLIFQTADRTQLVKPDATLLALGGASWPRLGADGSWVDILARYNIPLAPLEPANGGFVVNWSEMFRQRFAGQPVKPVNLIFAGHTLQGELMITGQGVEGGVIYARSAALRTALAQQGHADITLDLRPGLSLAELTHRLNAPRSSQTFSNYLRKCAGLSPVAMGLLYDAEPMTQLQSLPPHDLAKLIKAHTIRLLAPCPIERAISTAGGIRQNALDDSLMLRNLPGVFAAGEILDWEAPTGGYLLQACFSTGITAARGMLNWLKPR